MADMTEEELAELGRAAYAAHYDSTEHGGVRVWSPPWDALHPMWQRAWVAAARAVADKLTAAGTEEPECDGCDSPPMKGDTICSDCVAVMRETDAGTEGTP
jgi:hypothetical protein